MKKILMSLVFLLIIVNGVSACNYVGSTSLGEYYISYSGCSNDEYYEEVSANERANRNHMELLDACINADEPRAGCKVSARYYRATHVSYSGVEDCFRNKNVVVISSF